MNTYMNELNDCKLRYKELSKGESPHRLWGPFSLLLYGYWGSSPQGKRSGRDADNSPLVSIVPRLRICAAVTLLTLTSSLRGS
jgi:hypothetical protein